VEGNDGIPGGGGYKKSEDNINKGLCPYGTVKGGITSIEGGIKDEGDPSKDVSNPCEYKSVSCINSIPPDSEWGDNFTNNPVEFTQKNHRLKKQCQLCVIGSKMDGTTRRVLANLGKTPDSKDVPPSNFAYDLCDAMVAGCEKALFYANNKQDWNSICDEVDKTTWTNNKLNKAVCKLLKNSIIQFFLGFMGGIECTLKIKAYEFKKAMSCDLCKINPTCSKDDEKQYC